MASFTPKMPCSIFIFCISSFINVFLIHLHCLALNPEISIQCLTPQIENKTISGHYSSFRRSVALYKKNVLFDVCSSPRRDPPPETLSLHTDFVRGESGVYEGTKRTKKEKNKNTGLCCCCSAYISHEHPLLLLLLPPFGASRLVESPVRCSYVSLKS